MSVAGWRASAVVKKLFKKCHECRSRKAYSGSPPECTGEYMRMANRCERSYGKRSGFQNSF